jgi:hypothetical protein
LRQALLGAAAVKKMAGQDERERRIVSDLLAQQLLNI